MGTCFLGFECLMGLPKIGGYLTHSSILIFSYTIKIRAIKILARIVVDIYLKLEYYFQELDKVEQVVDIFCCFEKHQSPQDVSLFKEVHYNFDIVEGQYFVKKEVKEIDRQDEEQQNDQHNQEEQSQGDCQYFDSSFAETFVTQPQIILILALNFLIKVDSNMQPTSVLYVFNLLRIIGVVQQTFVFLNLHRKFIHNQAVRLDLLSHPTIGQKDLHQVHFEQKNSYSF